MSTIAQLVTEISATPAPVVFLDTCAILDVARAPARNQPDLVPAAQTLIRLAGQTPPGVFLLVPDVVGSEWKDHIDSAREVAAGVVRDYGHVSSVALVTGLTSAPAPLLDPKTFSDLLRDSSEMLLTSAKVIDRDPRATSAAVDRVVGKRKPSGKKGQVKDSYILEHCLSVASALGGPTFPRWVVFVSSNVEDFATGPTNALHRDLAGDFASAGLKYVVSLGSAVADLRTAGQIP